VPGGACAGLGFPAYYALIARAGAGRAAVITYVSPVVAPILGVAFRHKPATQ
jgi:drug/metabolite transporter (DMT)-like permease